MRIAGRTITIVGDGEAAAAKARLLGETAARIRLVSAQPAPELRLLCRHPDVTLVEVPFQPAHLEGAALVFAATGHHETDRIVVDAARAAGIPVNAVDHPDLCDFLTPALVNRAPVAVAISTNGAGPVLARQLREKIERILPAFLGDLAALAAEFRETVNRFVPAGRHRRNVWQEFFSGPVAHAVLAGKAGLARRHASRLISRQPSPTTGRVSLVGAGPGAIDLLTLRAQRLLQEADTIVHDRLVPEDVIAMGRRDARRINVGKAKGDHTENQDRINEILVREASLGRNVVRLKGGDPMVFGRAGEEIAALRRAGIAFEIVPGITAALAAAAEAEIPATLRGTASSLVFTTGHDRNSNVLPDWTALSLSGATIAVYMARSVAADVSARLTDAGLDPHTPVAVVENAGRDAARRYAGTLGDLAAVAPRSGRPRRQPPAPALILIGPAVAHGALNHAEAIADWTDMPAKTASRTLAA